MVAQVVLGADVHLAQACPGLDLAAVVCINHHAAAMPLPFFRPSIVDGVFTPEDSFRCTIVDDPSFRLVQEASFLVFDVERGLEILGPSPALETVFSDLGTPVHEAPVYVPSLNSIIVSALEFDIVPQLIIDLNEEPPTIANFTPAPPIYGVNGGRFFNGTVYWAVAGSNFTFNGHEFLQAPGIYALDPVTRSVSVAVNNYFGQQFNGPDDLVIDDNGDIFFTDPWYGFALGFTVPPVLHEATYRFRPSTGAVSVVELDISTPNGIGLSPDRKIMYITDTGITTFDLNDTARVPGFGLLETGPKAVYAFDLVDSPPGKYLVNKRPVWYPEQFADDGFQVAWNGYLLGAAGFSVDVLSEFGELLVKIQTNFVVNNIQFAGPDLDELWLFGQGAISRVRWNLKGQSLT